MFASAPGALRFEVLSQAVRKVVPRDIFERSRFDRASRDCALSRTIQIESFGSVAQIETWRLVEKHSKVSLLTLFIRIRLFFFCTPTPRSSQGIIRDSISISRLSRFCNALSFPKITYFKYGKHTACNESIYPATNTESTERTQTRPRDGRGAVHPGCKSVEESNIGATTIGDAPIFNTPQSAIRRNPRRLRLIRSQLPERNGTHFGRPRLISATWQYFNDPLERIRSTRSLSATMFAGISVQQLTQAT